MGEFTPINTQEELEAVLKDRLARESKKYEELDKQFKEAQAQLQTAQSKIQDYEKTVAGHKDETEKLNKSISEANEKLKGYERDALRTKIALESSLPYDMKDYLKGETEEEIKASAEILSKFAKGSAGAPPLNNPEGAPKDKDPKDAAYEKMLKELKGE